MITFDRTMSKALLAALIALAAALLFPGQAAAQSEQSEHDATYGAWMLAPGETLRVRIEAEAHHQYVASNCANDYRFRVNGGEMYNGVVLFPGVDVTVFNGTTRTCWIEIRGRMDRCVGDGCPDISNHWAVRNKGYRSGAGAVRFAREIDAIFSNDVIRFIMILIVGTIAGSAVVEMFRRISLGEEDDEAIDDSDIDFDDEYYR